MRQFNHFFQIHFLHELYVLQAYVELLQEDYKITLPNQLSMLLLGKPVVKQLKIDTATYLSEHNLTDGYVAIFLLSDNIASEVYVSLKAKHAKKIGIYADIKLGKDWSIDEVREELTQSNNDPKCLWILVQLPLADHLKPHQLELLEMIDPAKDIDGLTSSLFGQAWFGKDFLGATPQASMHILDYYGMWDVKGKVCMVISQSNLIGKPLALELMKRGATVLSTNSKTSPEMFQNWFDRAEVIFAATGVKHLIHKWLINENSNISDKILMDIGRWSDDDWPHGDIDREFFQDKVRGVTPVPGGVGPVTVATLFHNILKLRDNRDQ